MPLRWNIAHKSDLVSLHSEGVVRLGDMVAYLQALESDGAFACRKLFDARLGPCAVVASDDSVVAHKPFITQLMLTKRPLGIFRDIGDAEHWMRVRQ
jgi:hypothetical protein